MKTAKSLLVLVSFLLITVGKSQDKAIKETGDFLLNAGFVQYNMLYNHEVLQRSEFPILHGIEILKMANSEWKSSLSVAPGKNGKTKIKFELECLEGELRSSKLFFSFNFKNWSDQNYVLLPAAIYAGNRFESRRIRYSPKLLNNKDIGKDVGPIISDVPRLNNRKGPSSVSLRSGDLSMPSFGFYDSNLNRSLVIQFSTQSNFGDNGVDFQESSDRKSARLSISAPVVREGTKYFIADNEMASDDQPFDFKTGDKWSVEFQVDVVDNTDLLGLFKTLFTSRHSFYDYSLPEYSISFSQAFSSLENKFNNQNFVEEFGYYSVGMRENYMQDWQIGWTGGLISTLPLFKLGDDQTKRNVIRNLNWLFPEGLAPSGLFWDAGEKGVIWYGGDQRNFHTKNWHLIRKSGDGLFYLIELLNELKKSGVAIEDKWKKGAISVAMALQEIWKNNEQLGQFVNNETGEIIVGGSTSGGIIPAALILASEYFQNDTFKDSALEIGEYYYQNFVKKGLTYGGPGDALQNPDSESAYALLKSFMMLYEKTNDKKWLDRAEVSAQQFSTWVMNYDYSFPEESLFGRLNKKTTGAVWANTQNKHGSPGICTHSGDALLDLYRETGDARYLYLLQEIVRSIPQYLSHQNNPIPGLPNAWMSERINTTDWLEGIGEIMYGSTWAETALMLTVLEIPGVYVDLENNLPIAFDQVELKSFNIESTGMELEIFNPHTEEIKVSIMVDSQKRKLSRRINDSGKLWKEVYINPNETITVKFY